MSAGRGTRHIYFIYGAEVSKRRSKTNFEPDEREPMSRRDQILIQIVSWSFWFLILFALRSSLFSSSQSELEEGLIVSN